MIGNWKILSIIILASAGLVFLVTSGNSFSVNVSDNKLVELANAPETDSSENTQAIKEINIYDDIEPQRRLSNPPKVIKAIYATSWSASSKKKMDYLIDLIKTTELNAIVIDIKDYSGLVLYDIDNKDVEKYNAKEVRIRRLNVLIRRLHDEGIYVIARQTMFQDPALAKARPDLAVIDNRTGKTWEDRKKISWVDPASKEVWDYNIAIAKDASSRGFDEINFDYIRFPSDGKLSAMSFPFYDIDTQYKKDVIKLFFGYLRSNTTGITISADLFGLTTVNNDDLGIGQVIEDAYLNFDYIAPMVYPSHYSNGFNGYASPAEYPYEVVNYSMEKANERLQALASTTGSDSLGKLRPWIQDFDLGAEYTASMVRKQIQGTYDAGVNTGWMLWNPRNNYTKGALQND